MSANPTNHFPALARPSSGEIPKVQPDAQGRASFAVLDLFSGIGGLARDQLTAIGNSLVPQVALIWIAGKIEAQNAGLSHGDGSAAPTTQKS